MCRCFRPRFATVTFLCMIVYSHLQLSSSDLFGWLPGRKRITNSALQLDHEALDAEETGEERIRSSAKRGPDGCGHKLKVALAVVKAYGASFKHWHWPWRKRRKSSKNDNNGQQKRQNVDEHLRTVDHCAAIAEREEYQRAHFGQQQLHRRQRRRVRGGHPREMNDKNALKTLTRMLRRKNRTFTTADHWANIGVIRWGRRTIRNIRTPAAIHSATKRDQHRTKLNIRKSGKFKNDRRRRMKREEDDEEEEDTTDDEGGSSSDEDAGGDGNGTKFTYSKKAHGYSNNKSAGSDAKDKIYETESFEAEHPEKGRYVQRTTTEYKFHGPKHSEWRHRPPKPPKTEGKAWTGKFKNGKRGRSRQRAHFSSRGSSRKGRKSRRGGRWKRKRNLAADYGDGYYYTVAHPLPYSYGHYYDGYGGNPWGYTYYSENYYGGGGFGHGGGGGAYAEKGGFMPSGGLGEAMKMFGIILFVLLLIIII